MFRFIKRKCRSTIGHGFLRDESGVVTIEFVVVLPFFMLLFVFFLDTCMLFFTYNDLSTVAQEAVRRNSTGELATMNEIRDFVSERLFHAGGTYTLTGELARANRTITIELPVVEASIFGVFLRSFVGTNLTATAEMRREPLP